MPVQLDVPHTIIQLPPGQIVRNYWLLYIVVILFCIFSGLILSLSPVNVFGQYY